MKLSKLNSGNQGPQLLSSAPVIGRRRPKSAASVGSRPASASGTAGRSGKIHLAFPAALDAASPDALIAGLGASLSSDLRSAVVAAAGNSCDATKQDRD